MIWPEEAHQTGRIFTNRAHAIFQAVHGDCFGNSGWPGPEPCWGVCQQCNSIGQLHASVQKYVVVSFNL